MYMLWHHMLINIYNVPLVCSLLSKRLQLQYYRSFNRQRSTRIDAALDPIPSNIQTNYHTTSMPLTFLYASSSFAHIEDQAPDLVLLPRKQTDHLEESGIYTPRLMKHNPATVCIF